MNFSDERYVRLYVRDTITWQRWGWEGQAVFSLLLRKFDKAGILDGIGNPADDVALVIGMPTEIVQVGLDRLFKSGAIVHVDDRLVCPNYVSAQFTARSAKARQAEKRMRDRADVASKHESSLDDEPEPKRDAALQPVTPRDNVDCARDEMSRSDTPSNGESQKTPSHPNTSHPNTDPPIAPQGADRVGPKAEQESQKPAKKPRKRGKPAPKFEMTDDWMPSEKWLDAKATALVCGRSDLLRHLPEFRYYFQEGKGCGKSRDETGWTRSFGSWMQNVVADNRLRPPGAPNPAEEAAAAKRRAELDAQRQAKRDAIVAENARKFAERNGQLQFDGQQAVADAMKLAGGD